MWKGVVVGDLPRDEKEIGRLLNLFQGEVNLNVVKIVSVKCQVSTHHLKIVCVESSLEL